MSSTTATERKQLALSRLCDPHDFEHEDILSGLTDIHCWGRCYDKKPQPLVNRVLIYGICQSCNIVMVVGWYYVCLGCGYSEAGGSYKTPVLHLGRYLKPLNVVSILFYTE